MVAKNVLGNNPAQPNKKNHQLHSNSQQPNGTGSKKSGAAGGDKSQMLKGQSLSYGGGPLNSNTHQRGYSQNQSLIAHLDLKKSNKYGGGAEEG